MVFKKLHNIIPFKNLLKLVFGFAVIIQLTVITYSHLNGFYTVDGAENFMRRFGQGTILSIIGIFLVAYPDLLVIRLLDRFFPLNQNLLTRIILQFSLTVFIAVIASTITTLLSNFISTYPEDLMDVLLINAMIFSVCNILLVVILEAWIFFDEKAESREITQTLEKELSQIRFEVLKKQINPHFMFNSLNVLSGLIARDPEKAQKFIDEFSHIYRYVLETIEEPIVTVDKELTFARSYMFLQKIRYGGNLIFNIDLPAALLNRYLPPLSLQVVLENVIKHNLISSEQPLKINISAQNNCLMIKNNIQLKISNDTRVGLGQENLTKRYALISSKVPEFRVGATHYQVTLPLIRVEDDEGSDY